MPLIAGDTLPTLIGARVELRQVRSDDASVLFAVFSDAQAMRYWSTPLWTRREQAVDYISGIHRGFRDGTLYQWGVALRGDASLIGTCTLFSIDSRNRRAELGFILRRDCWRSGLMGEAVSRLIAYAFEDLALHRIEADADPRNDACLRLLERLGFIREGLLRERWLVGGEANDTAFYGLLASDWAGRS